MTIVSSGGLEVLLQAAILHKPAELHYGKYLPAVFEKGKKMSENRTNLDTLTDKCSPKRELYEVARIEAQSCSIFRRYRTGCLQ